MRNKSLTIELIHPPHPSAIEDRLDAPLGLLYIASILESHGYNVRVNDFSGTPQEAWQVGWADIYGVTTYATSIQPSKKIARLCKDKNRNCKVVVGGAHPTAVPERMDSIFDIVVIGEGELAFLEIANDFPDNRRYYQKTIERNLDLYPNPAYHLVDLYSYKRTIKGKTSLTMLTSRGCPYRCAFCGLAKHHQVVKLRSPEAVVKEISYLKDKYGIEKYNFQDDTFTLNKKRLHRLLDLLKPLNIGFRCHGRAGLDRKEDYVRLKEAGCELIAWGIESGSQKILDRMNKQVTVADNENVIRWAEEAGITSRAFFIIGFPSENRKHIEETKRFIERADPDQYFVSNFIPYPGTDVWNNPEKYDVTWINQDFSNYFQIDGTGFGGINIETKSLTKKDFRKLEIDFRNWINRRKRRGSLLEYEKALEANHQLKGVER